MAKAKITEEAIRKGIQSFDNMNKLTGAQLTKLVDEIGKLGSVQKDQNYLAFKNSIAKHNAKLEEISRALGVLKTDIETKLLPALREWVEAGEENQNV
jgi:hypothetical protein